MGCKGAPEPKQAGTNLTCAAGNPPPLLRALWPSLRHGWVEAAMTPAQHATYRLDGSMICVLVPRLLPDRLV